MHLVENTQMSSNFDISDKGFVVTLQLLIPFPQWLQTLNTFKQLTKDVLNKQQEVLDDDSDNSADPPPVCG